MSLILFTVTCGSLLFSAFLAISTIWWWSMISHTTLELFLCAPSPRSFPPSCTSSPGCPLSSASLLRPSSVDNGREFDNSTSRSFFLSRGVQLHMSCSYTSPQNGKAERMIHTTNDIPHASGLRASTPPPTCSTAFRPLLLLLPLHTTTLFSVPILATTTFGSSGVRVTLTPLPLLLTS